LRDLGARIATCDIQLRDLGARIAQLATYNALIHAHPEGHFDARDEHVSNRHHSMDSDAI